MLKTRNLLVAILFCLLMVPAGAHPKERTVYQSIDEIIEGLDTLIPKDTIRAIAWQESGWQQFDSEGGPSNDGQDWGVMRVNECTVQGNPAYSLKKAKWDTEYNVRLGVDILEDKMSWIRHLRRRKDWAKMRHKYRLWGANNLEMAIRAYNGITRSTEYLQTIKKIQEEKPWKKYVK